MKKLKSPLLALAIAATGLHAGPATAADITLSGFINAIGNQHNADNMRYLETADDTLSFNNSNYGLNITSKIDGKLSVAAQIIGGVEGEDNIILEWGFAAYDISDETRIKFGIVKYPGNLYSETVDVGFVYPWIRPPESIYSDNAELFFETYKGAAVQYSGGDDIEFSVEVYGGNTPTVEGDGGIVESHKEMVGLTFSAANDVGEAKLGYNTSTLEATDTTIPAAIAGEDGKRYTIITLGAEAEFGDLQVIAEVAQSSLEGASDADSQGFYITFVYPINDWIPHFTYQDFKVDDGSVEQTSMTLGVNRKVGNNAVLKLEVQKINDIKGDGFFKDHLLGATTLPDGSDVTMINIALSVVF